MPTPPPHASSPSPSSSTVISKTPASIAPDLSPSPSSLATSTSFNKPAKPSAPSKSNPPTPTPLPPRPPGPPTDASSLPPKHQPPPLPSLPHPLHSQPKPRRPLPPPRLPSPKKPRQQAYVTAPTTPILDDPDRPILHSGQPTAPATTPELTTLPPDLHQTAAISDAANRPRETFAYNWPSATLRDQILRALEALALPSLTHYIAFNHLAPADDPNPVTTTKPGAPGPDFRTRVHTQPPPPPITIENPQLLAYTLNDAPTYILTAESPLTTNGPTYLTLIAQATPDAHLHLALLSITDATHLNRTPRLLPIDAVDPDATGRAALLFELRSQTTRQFALYNLTTPQPQQLLLTTPIASPPAN